jgi:hypothetical protein
MLNKVTLAIGLLALAGGLADNASARTLSALEVENKKAAVDDVVQSEMAVRGIPGLQLSIVRKGKIVFTGAYGQANINAKMPVTENTVFQINSITKAFLGLRRCNSSKPENLILMRHREPISPTFRLRGKALPRGNCLPICLVCRKL